MANLKYTFPTFKGIVLKDSEHLPYGFIKIPSPIIRYSFPCIYAITRKLKGEDGKMKDELVCLWKAKTESEVQISVLKHNCAKQYKALSYHVFTSDFSQIDSIFDKLLEVYGDSLLCK